MKIICTQENLNKALNIVGKVVNKNTTLPILNNILLKTDKNGLKLNATNLELGVTYWIGGKVEEEGEITVPTKLFANFISNLPGENVEIKTREDMINIKCEGYKTNIKGVDAKEYPLTPKLEIDFLFKISGGVFKKALSQVLPAISVSESRMEITGVLMDFSNIEKGEVVLVATDSYRLAQKTLKLNLNEVNLETLKILGDIKSVIIPKNAVQEVVKSLEESEVLEVVVTESQILFSFGNANILSRLINGKYPDYKQIIPDKFLSKVVVKTSDIMHAIKAASFFANIANNSVKVKVVGKEKIEVSSETNGLGDNVSRLNAKTEGQDVEVIYNYKYLIDGLNSLGDDTTLLNINNDTAPSIIQSVQNNDFIYIVMPIRS